MHLLENYTLPAMFEVDSIVIQIPHVIALILVLEVTWILNFCSTVFHSSSF
jgi:hypothetical protein